MFNSRFYAVLFTIGVAALTIRTTLDSQFRNSTLLYLLIPFGLSVLLHILTPFSTQDRAVWRYVNHLRDGTIVMLATSAFLFEGFLCVLMFMPIYYFGITLGFLFARSREKREAAGLENDFRAYAVPVLVLMLSLEGTARSLSFERYREATHVEVINASIEQLQANMARPIALPAKRQWFLALFPLPTDVKAGSLGVGDIHTMHFTYKRWFFANYHEGDMAVRIAAVSPDHIRTEIIRNTSYLSHYMKIDGTDVRFRDLGGGRTRVALTIRYQRLLDPYWYFGPMQQFAAEQSAQYLIDAVIRRERPELTGDLHD